MNLLPFENTNLHSPLSQSEIENTIRKNVAWNTELGMTFSQTPLRELEGFVEKGTFRIRRILKGGRKSFIPIVTGFISEKENGSEIELKIRLHKLVMIFILVVTLFLFVTSLSIGSSEPHDPFAELMKDEDLEEIFSQPQFDELRNRIEAEPEEKDWSSLLFILAPILISTIVFNYEAYVIKGKLKLLLKVDSDI